MAKTVNVPTQANFDFTTLQKTIPLPRREAARLLTLNLMGAFAVATGTTGSVGGAAPAPLQPLGAINQLKIAKNPSGMQGELNFSSAQLALLQNVVIPLKRRVASRTAPSAATTATYTVFAEMMIPYSLPGDDGETSTPVASADSWEVLVTGQSSAANLKAAIYTSADGTLSYDTTNPLTVSATVEFCDQLPGGPLMEIACAVDRFVLDSTEKSFDVKSIQPGEVPLLFVLQNWDNNVRAVLPGYQGSFIEASYGSGETFYSARPATNVYESQTRYGIRDGDMPTGAYFVDPVAIFGSVAKIPLVGQSGGTPSLRFRLGSAPTSPAWIDCLSIRGRWTKAGLAAIAAAQAQG